MAITEDASTPAIVSGTGSGGTNTIVTASFTPPANTLLVALVGNVSSLTSPTIALSDSVSGTWTQAVQAISTASFFGLVKIYYRYLSSAPGAMTVTGTYTNAGGRFLAVRVLNGAKSVQTGAGTGSTVNGTNTTAGTTSITTTITGSQVYGLSNDTSANTPLTLNGSTSLLTGGDFADATDTGRMVGWKATSTTGTPGATTLGGTWGTTSKSNIVAFEVLPAAAVLLWKPTRGPNYRR